MAQAIFQYGTDHLTAGIALDICEGRLQGILNDNAKNKIRENRNIVEKVVSNEQVVYGITTGFGPLCTTFISRESANELQYKLLKSHSVGVGEFIPQDLSKLMLILKVHALAKGHSGITLEVIEQIIWHIENDVIPCVPEQGSVGASGDLAPLAHLFLPLIGLGEVHFEGAILPADQVLSKFNKEPVKLQAKEGLALINGTQFMAAYAVRILERLQNCLDSADIIAAMNIEAMMGSAKPFHQGLHDLRPYQGNSYVAKRMRDLLDGSDILKSHEHCEKVQDPYSLRCIPQVHGASRNAWLHFKETIHTEINSVTDNPILLDEDNIISGGNFHGQPIALPLDYITLAAAELGNISDRRIYLSLEGKPDGPPKLLMKETGLNSGFMIPQYTTAALVTENKSLCFPASADSIPTSLGQEDHVSMGSISARKAYKVVENLEKILGIELLCAAQGLNFKKPLKSTPFIEVCHALVRKKIPFRESDELFTNDLKSVVDIIKNKELAEKTTKIAQELKIEFKNERHEVFGIY
ncbi:histidine ammonia-lyase [Fulvivirgaceae bacterium BMA10]|uniref:Histidine ammonia-lyase n=1 Tax=Splendidivirga corallicola TaxID=3051826 RepID=A0ABT8L1X1_9BACT|nr:histidine ammonia-lyase [Fulvivirgaceae bacterium BMA10]